MNFQYLIVFKFLLSFENKDQSEIFKSFRISTLQLLINFSLDKSSERLADSGGSITSDSESKDTRDKTRPADGRYRDKRARRECNQILRTNSKQNSIV